jgi:hypothetical protein
MKEKITQKTKLELLYKIFIIAILFSCNQLNAQSLKVSGVVLSMDDKQPLPFTVINVKGTSIASAANEDGKFEIAIPHANDTLIFVMVSMLREVVAVNGKTNLVVYLKKDKSELKEVVVTALGIKKEKKALGYAVQEVKGEDLQTAKDASVINQLAGKVAGLNITSTTGGPGSSSRIVLRGVTSLSGSNQALIVVDGVPIENNTSNNTTCSFKTNTSNNTSNNPTCSFNTNTSNNTSNNIYARKKTNYARNRKYYI